MKIGNIDLKWKIMILIILLVLLLSLIYVREQSIKKYYKNQMINFCELSKSLLELLIELREDVPKLEQNCSYWEIG